MPRWLPYSEWLRTRQAYRGPLFRRRRSWSLARSRGRSLSLRLFLDRVMLAHDLRSYQRPTKWEYVKDGVRYFSRRLPSGFYRSSYTPEVHSRHLRYRALRRGVAPGGDVFRAESVRSRSPSRVARAVLPSQEPSASLVPYRWRNLAYWSQFAPPNTPNPRTPLRRAREGDDLLEQDERPAQRIRRQDLALLDFGDDPPISPSLSRTPAVSTSYLSALADAVRAGIAPYGYAAAAALAAGGGNLALRSFATYRNQFNHPLARFTPEGIAMINALRDRNLGDQLV